ncbi:MAG: hypothetical protein HOM11_11765 [Methylococcales bacterium]|nr:hypothetical protein [Methylococcales bacterium]MBT7443277.1 hypothetical protein [Methylococcales bacterium]
MKRALLLVLFISLSSCLQTTSNKAPEPRNTPQGTIDTWLNKDANLTKRFYPTPIVYEQDKYDIEVFEDFIRYIHKIKHSGFSSPIDSYLKTDARNDEIAQRYSDFIQRRGNRIQAVNKDTNRLLSRFVEIKTAHGHYQRNNLDEALIEYTPEGKPISILLRANLFSSAFNMSQLVNTYQIQQSFIIYGPKVKTIVRKLKFEIKAPQL